MKVVPLPDHLEALYGRSRKDFCEWVESQNGKAQKSWRAEHDSFMLECWSIGSREIIVQFWPNKDLFMFFEWTRSMNYKTIKNYKLNRTTMRFTPKTELQKKLIAKVSTVEGLAKALEMTKPTLKKCMDDEGRFFLHQKKVCELLRITPIEMANLIYSKEKG